ncbi:hypothetical protein WR25_10775 [Diploscapter pachys]|uniref:Uncharacterized protein n=1 Tax=Diploscapter pachys TaxID=2018661 RepID=A0A2A2JBR8_9BILA|nr:hypothetical protein WR25_10775 [Diploscapter pachys]
MFSEITSRRNVAGEDLSSQQQRAPISQILQKASPRAMGDKLKNATTRRLVSTQQKQQQTQENVQRASAMFGCMGANESKQPEFPIRRRSSDEGQHRQKIAVRDRMSTPPPQSTFQKAKGMKRLDKWIQHLLSEGDLADYRFLQFHFPNFDQKGLKRVALSYKCRSFLALLEKKKKRQSDTFK